MEKYFTPEIKIEELESSDVLLASESVPVLPDNVQQSLAGFVVRTFEDWFSAG